MSLDGWHLSAPVGGAEGGGGRRASKGRAPHLATMPGRSSQYLTLTLTLGPSLIHVWLQSFRATTTMGPYRAYREARSMTQSTLQSNPIQALMHGTASTTCSTSHNTSCVQASHRPTVHSRLYTAASLQMGCTRPPHCTALLHGTAYKTQDLMCIRQSLANCTDLLR